MSGQSEAFHAPLKVRQSAGLMWTLVCLFCTEQKFRFFASIVPLAPAVKTPLQASAVFAQWVCCLSVHRSVRTRVGLCVRVFTSWPAHVFASIQLIVSACVSSSHRPTDRQAERETNIFSGTVTGNARHAPPRTRCTAHTAAVRWRCTHS